jgi:hypothetical protein
VQPDDALIRPKINQFGQMPVFESDSFRRDSLFSSHTGLPRSILVTVTTSIQRRITIRRFNLRPTIPFCSDRSNVSRAV